MNARGPVEVVGDAVEELVWGHQRWLLRALLLVGVGFGVAGTLLVQGWLR